MIPQRTEETLEDFLHDVNSKCDSLKNAAALLPNTSPERADALLRLMSDQIGGLARIVAEFQRKREP